MSVTISGDTGVDKFEGTTIAGHVIQVANYTTGAMTTINTVIPNDNTIPQITEGTQVLSLSLTPKKANSKLKITVCTVKSCSGGIAMFTALFRDSTSDAIAVSVQSDAGAGYTNTNTFVAFVNANTTNPTTFTVRLGSGGTITLNGSGGVGTMGGVCPSSITIEEIAQ